MRYLFLVALLSFTQIITAQPKEAFDSTKVRPIVLEYVDSIRGGENSMTTWYIHHNRVKGYIITNNGLSGSISEQFKLYQRMLKITTKEEWFVLLNHHYPEIRYYAFRALLKYDIDRAELIPQIINDTDFVMFQRGCSMKRVKMKELLLDITK